MERISIDCNIFDELIKDDRATEKLRHAIAAKNIEIVISPTVLIELQKAESKHGVTLAELIDYKILVESTSLPPFIPGKAIIGGDTKDFNQFKGNKTNPKRLKDPRIIATLKHHGIDLLVTQNTKDFKAIDCLKVINFSDFKKQQKWV